MSNETQYSYFSAQVTAAAGTAALASNNMSGPGEVSAIAAASHANYPLADFVLFASFGSSVAAASQYIVLYRRDLNIDGTNDAPIPQTAAPAYSALPVGAFIIPPYTAASSGYFSCPDVPLGAEQEFYIENKTNAQMASTWTLKMKAKTFTPAA